MDPVAVEVRRCSQESIGSTKPAFNSARNRLLSAKSLVFGQILIKIPLKSPQNEEDRNKPTEEICILMRQRHQNIVALYGLYEQIWKNCIQFCPVIEDTLGPSLQKIIENEDPYTPADIYSWGYQTCRALEYLHDGLTVHLDVKPANLVVDATKKRLKLCDFDNALKLETGQPVGELYHAYTTYYVAPEILEECSFGNERVLKMDMYSFGVTLYVLFQKPNRQEMEDGYSIMKILSEDVPDKHINREKITDEKTAEFIERKIAVKEFFGSREQPLERYRKEIEILIQHKHPNIVQLYGILWNGSDKSILLGYVMEYVEGGSLHKVIYDTTKSYDSLQMYLWIEQIARGIEFLHKYGIIHRDIKPENILVAGDHLKLADFGVAKDVAGAGTIHYMAPEALNPGKCSHASDVYSLAITIWEIFHRKVPYFELRNPTLVTLSNEIIRGVRPSIEPNKMNKEVEALVQKCWEATPSDRLPVKDIINIFEMQAEALSGQMGSNTATDVNVSELQESTEEVTLTEVKWYTRKDVADMEPIGSSDEGTGYKGSFGSYGNVCIKVFNVSDENRKEEISNLDLFKTNRHNNIVIIYGKFLLDDSFLAIQQYGYIMEFMEQGSLKSVIESKKGYSTGRICSWMAMATDGIQFLIEKNVHYRNVRPTNDSTCFYIAPEVLSGEGDVKSAVADVYAIGIIIWELFYRKPPYTEKRTLELCKSILNGERPSIDSLVPDEMQKLIERCWSHDTGNRPSLAELINFFKETRSQEESQEVEGERRLEEAPRKKRQKLELQTEELSETMKPLKVSTDTPEMEDLQDSISSHSLFELIEIKYQTFIFRGNPLLEKIGPNWRRLVRTIDNLEKIPIQMDKETILVLGGGGYSIGMVILTQDRWIKLALKLPKKLGGAVYLDGEIYVFGGWDMNTELYKLDNKTLRWVRLAHMNEIRGDITNSSVEWNGSIWVFGGWNVSRFLKSVERYDPKENKWIWMPDMKYSRYHAAAAVHNGKFIVCGGLGDGWNRLKSVECFDPESGVWTELNDMPTPLNDHSLVSYGNNLILMGGWNGNIAVNNVLELSNLEGKGTWKQLPPMRGSRYRFSVANLDNQLFVIGGSYGIAGYLDETEIFNGKSWRGGPQLPNVCREMSSIVISRHLAVDILFNYR